MGQLPYLSIATGRSSGVFEFGDFHDGLPARNGGDTATVYIFYGVKASFSRNNVGLECELFGSYMFFSSPPLQEDVHITLIGDLELLGEDSALLETIKIRMRFGPYNSAMPHKFNNVYATANSVEVASIRTCRLFGHEGLRA